MKNRKKCFVFCFSFILLMGIIFAASHTASAAVGKSVKAAKVKSAETGGTSSDGINDVPVSGDSNTTKEVTVTTDRKKGTATYKVTGLDAASDKEIKLLVTYKNSNSEVVTALEKTIVIEGNVSEGVYQGSFSLKDFKNYVFSKYTVNVKVGDETLTAADTVDFMVHTDKYKITVNGNSSSVERRFSLTSSESKNDVIVPGEGNQVKLIIWKKGTNADKAKTAGGITSITNKSKSWSVTISDFCDSYGSYYARMVLLNEAMEGTKSLGTIQFDTNVAVSKLISSKTKALEKKKSFRVTAKGVKSPFGVSSVYFDIYNDKGKKLLSKKAVRKGETENYQADISLKQLNYKLIVYTVKARVVDKKKLTKNLGKTVKVDETVGSGTFSVVKKANATCKFRLKGAYVPGGIKSLRFNVYSIKSGKKKFIKRLVGVYNSKADRYDADIELDGTGKFIVYAYAKTAWGKSINVNSYSYSIKKNDLGKNGWHYEKYAGKTYKFYYKNNKKLTDLTDVLKLNKKGAQNYYIEVNRLACVVTVFAYDSVKKDYIIPVKTFTVCVGADVSSMGSAGSLNTDSSFTPLGTYSICSNGTAVRYSVKQMYEPDGQILYARWTTHIVGNVYFHSIAVGSNSHYALSASTYNRLGTPASAGCIRMAVLDAKWIYDYVATGSKVVIKQGSSSKPGPLGKNKTIKVSDGINYDPTDPDVPDSTKKKDFKAGRISGYIAKNGKKFGNIANQ